MCPEASSRMWPTTRTIASSSVCRFRTSNSDSGASLFASRIVAPSRVIERVWVRSMYCCPSRSEPTTSICRTTAAGLARRCLAMDVSPFLVPTGGWTRHAVWQSGGQRGPRPQIVLVSLALRWNWRSVDVEGITPGEARCRDYRAAWTIPVLAAMIMDNGGSPVVSLGLRKCNPSWRIEEFSRRYAHIRRSAFTLEEGGSICLPSTRSIKSADS